MSSIFVAVRVRPPFAEDVDGFHDPAYSTPRPPSASNNDTDDANNAPASSIAPLDTVVGTLRFVNDTHVTFTERAMEYLESEKILHGTANSGTPRRSTTPRRSGTPPASSRSRAVDGVAPQRNRSPRAGSGKAVSTVTAAAVARTANRLRLTRPVFQFDCCFTSQSDKVCFGTQRDVYNELGAPLLERLLSGYNCCLMAYGQTGSGKTYAMLGPHALPSEDLSSRGAQLNLGLPPRSGPSRLSTSLFTASSLCKRLQHDEERGLMFRFVEQMLQELSTREASGRKASINAIRAASSSASPKPSSSATAGIGGHYGTSGHVGGSSMGDATQAMVKYEVEATYYQIYREKVYCLLRPNVREDVMGSPEESLKIRENAITGPYVEGLAGMALRSSEDLVALLDRGTRSRRVSATSQNMHSSRSHAVLSIHVRCIRSSFDASFKSTIHLVDLAGSERTGRYGDTQERIAESSDINNSLSCLGKIIHMLSTKATSGGQRDGARDASQNSTAMGDERKPSADRRRGGSPSVSRSTTQRTATTASRGGVISTRSPHRSTTAGATVSSSSASNSMTFIPYRESTLTFLLKDSIGGNSRTVILSTVSPNLNDVAETLSTLRYASKARHIVNTPIVNTDEKSVLLVNTLREECSRLRRQLQETLHLGVNRELERLVVDKERQLVDYDAQIQTLEDQRQTWEGEKVRMLERVILLEQEASELRGELTAVRETADQYKRQLETLQSLADRIDSGHAVATASTSAASRGPTAASEDAPATAAANAANAGRGLDDHRSAATTMHPFVTAVADTSKHHSEKPIETSSAAFQSQAIIFHRGGASSVSSRAPPPTSTTVSHHPEYASYSREPLSLPPHPYEAPPVLRNSSLDVTVMSTVSSATAADDVLPDRFQRLLQGGGPQARAVAAAIPRAGSNSSTDSSSPVQKQHRIHQQQRQGVPQLAASRAPVVAATASAVRAPADSTGDEFDDLPTDHDGLVRAALAVGIDIDAVLKAAKREKKQQRDQPLPQSSATTTTSGLGSSRRSSKAAHRHEKDSTVTHQQGPPDVVSSAPKRLPPPSFVLHGGPPPPLRPPTATTTAALVASASTPPDGPIVPPIPLAPLPAAPPGGSAGSVQSAQQPSMELPLPAAVVVDPAASSSSSAVNKLMQKLRDQSPPAPLRR